MKLRFMHKDFAREAGIDLKTWGHWLDAGEITLGRWGLDIHVYDSREMVAASGNKTGYYTYMEARLLSEYFGINLPE